MKKLAVVLMVVLLFGIFSDAIARRGGGSFGRSRSYSRSRSSSSSRKSSGYGSSKTTSKTTASKPTKADQKAYGAKVKQQQATRTNNRDVKSFKNMNTKSASYKKTDSQLTKNIGKSGKTYTNRTEAKTAMTTKMAEKKYSYTDSKVAMSNRPSYVPNNYSVGGSTYVTSYHGGHYGYYNPSGLFVAYVAANMIANDMMLHSYGYRPVYRQPVQQSASTGGVGYFIGMIVMLLVIGTIVGVSIYIVNKESA